MLFWSDGQERLDDEDGDVELVYLKMLAKKLIAISLDGWNVNGALSLIEDAEGWCSLNDKFGVKLISMDNWEFIERDIELNELLR